MKRIPMKCPRCGAPVRPEPFGDHMVLTCPYCGDGASLLVDSDRVRTAQIEADTVRTGMLLGYREKRDRMAEARSLLWIRTGVICVVAVIVLVLLVITLS